MQMPMALGALVCFLLGRLVRESSTFATAYHPGTVLYFLGDIFFLTLPVVAWMIFRGRGWWHGVELGVAMLVPVAVIVVIGELTRFDHLLWLVTAMYPAMSLGMLVYLFRIGKVFDRKQQVINGLASSVTRSANSR
jgi:hypothetical protein